MRFTSEFRKKDSEVGKILKYLFNLPYLLSSEVLNYSIDNLMAIKSKDDNLDNVFDFTYIWK